MRILITGVAGFIGFHLAEAALSAGAAVSGIDSLNDYYPPRLKQARLDILKSFPGFSFFHGHIEDRPTLGNLIAAFKPTAIVHLAAQAGVRYSLENPDAYIKSNIAGFQNVIDLAREYQEASFVYASSSSVYGSTKELPFHEDQPVTDPVSLYAATKISNELVSRAYFHAHGFRSIGLRFFTVYGPFSRPDMAMYSFARRMALKQPIQLFNNGVMFRDFTYIDDIVRGILGAVARRPSDAEIYNLGRGSRMELRDMVSSLERHLGKKANIDLMPMQAGDIPATLADISRARKMLGYNPVTDLDTGVRHFCDWFKDHELPLLTS